MSQEMIEGYRLSPQQRHLWMLGLSERSAVCAVQIAGDLDIEALQRAISHVVSCHEILRTTFKLLPGMTIPVQVISDIPEFSFTTNDLAELGVADRDARVNALVNQARERKSDYERLPLLHVDVIKCSHHKHVMIVALPALCADVPSLQCFIEQIPAAYSISSQTQPKNIGVLQYADFAEWNNELLEGEAGSSGRRYWRELDLSEPTAAKLNFEKRGGAEITFQPAPQTVEISAAASSQIRMNAGRGERGLSSFFLACWQILISRLTGHSNVLTGVATDGRKFAELEQAIGLFSKFVPVRSEVFSNLPFEEFLRRTSEQELEAQRFQEYFTWDNVHDNVAQKFFPFCFEFRKSVASVSSSDLEFLVYHTEACTDRFKIKFTVEDDQNRFAASLQFDSSLFSFEDARRLADQLSTLIEDASNRTDVSLGELKLLSPAERQLLVVELNQTLRLYSSGKLAHELFEEQVQERPDENAVVFEGEKLSYRGLNARTNQLAHYLIKLGVGPDMPVGLCLERSLDLIVGLLGIMKAGGAYVPLDPGVPQARLNMILAEAGARVLVTRSSIATALSEYVGTIVNVDETVQLLAKENSSNPARRACEANLAYVIFTSGSTGRPKGVAVEHRQLVNYIDAIWEKLERPEGTSFAMVSTISADLGNTALFTALCKKGTLHLISEERSTNPEALTDYFIRNQIDCLKIVPTHLFALLSAGNAAAVLPRHKLVLGGDACSWSLVDRIRSLSQDCLILNHYGPTEATVGALTHEVPLDYSKALSETVPLGRPLGNVETYILDEELQPLPIGVAGELHIGGAGLARCYINRPDATAEKFIPDPFSNNGKRLYKSGDRARYLRDGQIEFLGRLDNQVKIHGYRIELGEIELALRDHEDVTENVVLARDDSRGARQLVAYLVTRQHKKLTAGELRTFLNDKLPEHMVPTSFVLLDQLPLTANGKLDRNALPEPEHHGERVFTAPRNNIEKILVGIWSDVLSVERVGVHDNFFDLGGDSILSIQIVARANQAGLKLTPRQLFQHQTVAELALVVGSVIAAEQGIVTGRVQLTPIQLRFFELNQPELHHYNQSMLLAVQDLVDGSVFEKAIELLLVQHDALRFRYAKNHEGWEQFVDAPDGPLPFERVDLSAATEEEQTALIAEHAARLHGSLNLENGPLIRVALFDRGPQRPNYLLIVIHHLAVDGVSWRILLEDLQSVYQQLSSGDRPSLPAKTTSFKTWAERLTEHAQSSVLRDELSYWLAIGANSLVRLPLDKSSGTNLVADARTVSVSLNRDETQALLKEVPVAYRTHINEVLLTALLRAFQPWIGSQSLLIDLEGHGREEILEGVDLSRTVGWFTTIFPVVLNCQNAQSVVEALRSVKEQVRLIPNRGIGYGLLRYSGGDSIVAKKLKELPQAEVRFNYLGQVDRILLDSSMFSRAPESSGPMQSSAAERAYLLNIIGMVSNDQLRLDWTYSDSIHLRETVEGVAQRFIEELRELIAGSSSGGEIDYSPADFPRAKLSQDELNKVLAKLRG